MKKLTIIVTVFLLFASCFSWSQSDSSTVLTYDQYIEIVRTNHPVAKQAELQISMGDATLSMSRGAFDPKVFAEVAEKYYDGKQYYSVANGGFKIPTWFGVELNTSYEQTSGYYLNPENSTPSGGLWYTGISLPIGKGLFIDERRAELRKAELYQASTVLERRLMLNNLIFDAGKAYWDWFMAYHVQEVFEEGLQLAQQRFTAVKQGAEFGDRPSIDTLEAGIQVQNRMLGLQQSRLDFANASAKLSLFLWDEGMIPLEVAAGTLPSLLADIDILAMDEQFLNQIDTLISHHPELAQYRIKLDQMAIERRMKQEQLKPQFDLKYNFLTEPIGGNPIAELSPNNYTWGLKFTMPIFLRKERNSFKMTELKISDLEYEIKNKNAALNYYAISSLNDWSTTRDQIDLFSQTVRDYNGLLRGEQRMFDAGESSLFMVNAREVGYINSKIKLIELLAKNRKASLTTSYVFGILN